MPNFDTPEPISVTIGLGVGNLWITASDRTDTVVDVHPSDTSDDSDVRAARQVHVNYADGVLQVTGPKARAFDFSRKTSSVNVSVELPSGSRVSGSLQVGDVSGTGRLGECTFRTAAGNVRLERTGPLRVKTAAGDVSADGVAGDAEIRTGSGEIRIGESAGSVVVKNSNGDTTIDAVAGDVRVRSANGAISVDRAGADVEARTANGSIRIAEVAHGSVDVGTAMGDLEIGIAEGTAARLDVKSKFGRVHNLLDDIARPAASYRTAEVRAHTSFGGITIRRS